jgi:putative FmdB family regulatory protein
MPTYTYRCGNCGDRDIQHSIHEDARTTCESCDAPVRRLIGNPAITFAGGREFFSTTTISEALAQGMKDIRDSGGTPEPVGTRWV